jgi:hypothetical protein
VTVLKTAALREELRIRSYRAIRRRVLQALAAANLHPIVLKGAALSELVYPHAALRHTHDVELLIPTSEWDQLDPALAPLGFSGAASSPGASRRELTHVSGLPLVLHRRLFRIAFYNAPQDNVWMRTEPATLDGIAVQVLSPADMLVHACGDALHSLSLGSCRWIVDAWFLLDRRPRRAGAGDGVRSAYGDGGARPLRRPRACPSCCACRRGRSLSAHGTDPHGPWPRGDPSSPAAAVGRRPVVGHAAALTPATRDARTNLPRCALRRSESFERCPRALVAPPANL